MASIGKHGKHEQVSVDAVELDKNNPRIQLWIEHHKEVDESTLQLALGAGRDGGQDGGTTYTSLRDSIFTNGGIIQPIIVNRMTDGRMIVIEGNTRLSIYRQFKRDNVEGSWEQIPCIVYENLDADSIDAIRLQAHLVGPRAWNPYSKAKYLHHLRFNEHMDFGRLADFCGGRKREVQQLIDAYTDMESEYRPLVDLQDFDPKKFSSFAELQKPSIKDSILKAGFNLKDFAAWVSEDKFDRQEDVRHLPKILSNPRALEIFLNEGSKRARLIVEVSQVGADLSNMDLESLCTALRQKLEGITKRELDRIKSDPKQELFNRLDDVRSELNSTFEYITDNND